MSYVIMSYERLVIIMENEKSSKVISVLKWLLATIAVGLITSWLSPLISQKAAPFIYGILQLISSKLVDSIYESASIGLAESSSLMSNNTIQTFVAIGCLTLGITAFRMSRSYFIKAKRIKDIYAKLPNEEIEYDTPALDGSNPDFVTMKQEAFKLFDMTKRRYHKSIVVFIFYGLFFIAVMFAIITTDLSHVIAVNSLRNIDIVAPYISDNDYKMLLSDFYQMTSKNDFDLLMNKISDIASENGLTLKQ